MLGNSLLFTLPSQEIVSEIIIRKGILQASYAVNLLKRVTSRFALITDDKIKDRWALPLKKAGEKQGLEIHLFSFPPGEKSKTRQWKESLEDQMVQAGLGRDSAIIALGGGVVTDLAGFVAATYCRGIPFISIPTTLLGQVDASIGGKVAVNTPQGKNLIGAFYQPRFVLIDTDTLATLPPQEMVNGMAEVIKYALIASKSLFEKLHNPIVWEECIEASCAIKKRVVEQDPQEKGLRRMLNFGHTVGHALETLLEYQISHGEAVALGMLVESHLSYKLGYLQEEEFWKIKNLLEKHSFSLRWPEQIQERELLEVMSRDKKALKGQPRLVLLQSIGVAHPFEGAYCTPIAQHHLKESLAWLR